MGCLAQQIGWKFKHVLISVCEVPTNSFDCVGNIHTYQFELHRFLWMTSHLWVLATMAGECGEMDRRREAV